MQYSTSNLLKRILASGACAAVTLFGTLPAAAHPHDNGSKQTAAPARAARAAPVRVERAAPVRMERAAPVRVERAAPVRMERAAPVRMERAAPVRVERAAPVRVERAAPVRFERATPVRVERAAPVRMERAVPVRFSAPVRSREEAPAPFMQRVSPQHFAPQRVRERANAPFMQFVRVAPHRREAIASREVITRTVAASPLIRTVFASRTRTIPVVYHPRYLVGRVESVRRNVIVIDPPTGSPVFVRNVVVEGQPVVPVGSVATLPVTYVNGMYQYITPQYAYAPQYDYAYAPPVYCNGNSSTALYAALLPAVVGMLTGNGSNLNSSALASAALGAAGGAGNCTAYAPSAYYGQPYYSAPVNYGYAAPVSYAVPVTTYDTSYATPNYATPYDNCLYSDDEDGDENGCATTPYMYNGYNSDSSYAPYTPQQVQGVVIARSGDTLMVLGSSGTPTFVYAAPALQSGYTINGPIQPGQIVDAYGYYNGNTFVATALV